MLNYIILIFIIYRITKGKESLSGITFDKYPLTLSYILRLIQDKKLSKAFCLDDPVIPESNSIKEKVDPKTQTVETIYILNGNTEKPVTNKNHYRLYGHELCPDVESAFLAFASKNVKYQYWGMDLTTKADWHMKISGGTIPLLETPDGVILHKTKYIWEFIHEIHKNSEIWLLSENIVERLQEKILIDKTWKMGKK